jgi:PAS domain S-box-containing protein
MPELESEFCKIEPFGLILENTSDIITVFDREGTIHYESPSLERVLGYKPAELVGRNIAEFIHPEDFARVGEIISEAVEKVGVPACAEFQFRHKDGSWRYLEAVGKALPVGAKVFGVVTSRDYTYRKQAEESIRRHLARLAALRNVDMAIGASTDLRLTLNVLLEQVVEQLHVDAADILLLNPHSRLLEYAAGCGLRTKTPERVRLPLGESLAGHVALEQHMVQVPDLAVSGTSFGRAPLVAGEGFVAYFGAPLTAKGQNKGVLEVFHRAPLEPDQEWLDFFEALAAQAAIAIDSAQLFDTLQRMNSEMIIAYDSTIEGWSRALDLRDKETEGHTVRVTEMTVSLAQAFGIPEEELVQIRRGALLHDIGKMGVPDSILVKPGPLTEEEWAIMRKHPGFAYELLSPILFLRPALDIPYCHHEKWDGTGYPRGLKGEQIPLSARIFSVVDVWDALRSDRAYRKGWPEEQVREYIESQSGAEFDPQVVPIFLDLIKSIS